MALSELGKRVAVAVLGIPLTMAAVYLGGWLLGVVLATASALGTLELYRLAAARGLRPFRAAGAMLAATLILIATAIPTVAAATPIFWTAVLVAALLLTTAAIWARGTDGGPLSAVSVTLLGAVLLGGTLSYAVFLRYLPVPAGFADFDPRLRGCALVAFPLALTWVSDSGAYFGGRALGRRKLIPSVSPAKTVAGAIIAVVCSLLAGALIGWFLDGRFGLDLGIVEGALGGVLISVAAQLGDLAESLLKREAKVKDSGRLFPGHGGLLDRVDSLLFAIPAAFWYLGAVL